MWLLWLLWLRAFSTRCAYRSYFRLWCRLGSCDQIREPKETALSAAALTFPLQLSLFFAGACTVTASALTFRAIASPLLNLSNQCSDLVTSQCVFCTTQSLVKGSKHRRGFALKLLIIQNVLAIIEHLLVFGSCIMVSLDLVVATLLIELCNTITEFVLALQQNDVLSLTTHVNHNAQSTDKSCGSQTCNQTCLEVNDPCLLNFWWSISRVLFHAHRHFNIVVQYLLFEPVSLITRQLLLNHDIS